MQIAKEFAVEDILQKTLRPKFLDDFIGQQDLKNNLKVFIESAKIRNKPLDHVLISGPPGLGKTTLSYIISNELKLDIATTSGPLLEKQGDLAAILTALSPNQVLFIDEIHRMNRNIEEILYSAMEDFKLDIMIGQGPGAKSIKIDLPGFTLIGATTRIGMLSSPLRDRFGIPLRLGFYNEEEILEIVLRAADFIKQPTSKKAALEIASRSRGTPRIANRYLKRCYDFAVVKNEKSINLDVVNTALSSLKIDALGLDELDRIYLNTIADNYQGGPIGISTLSACISESKDTLEATCEPYLLYLGFLKKTARGRMLTDKAWKYLKKTNPNRLSNKKNLALI